VDQLDRDLPADWLISFSLPRTFGRMVDSKKQGYAIAAVMTSRRFSWTLTMWLQLQHHGTVPMAVGAAMEGVEQRFGVPDSAVFAERDHADLLRCRRLDARLVHQPGRDDDDVQHAAR
jgi:K+-transporting ATPase A subunit